MPDDDDNQIRAKMLYEQPKNSIDALFIGSSHVYRSINTGYLWDNYGIASYLLAGGSQPVWSSYYYMKEALKHQTPKAIVVDVYKAGIEADYAEKSTIVWNTFGMRPGLEKFQAILASSPPGDLGDYILGYPIFHKRYSELQEKDFDFSRKWKPRGFKKGYDLNNKIDSELDKSMISASTKTAKILNSKSEEYLYKIINLAKEKNIPLLFVNAPWIIDEENRESMNAVSKIADEETVPFIDACSLIDELDLIVGGQDSDFVDRGHLNYKGALKYSEFIGNWLKDNVDLPDRRGDENYESWQSDAEAIAAKIEELQSEQE